jgi:hypothetical protein
MRTVRFVCWLVLLAGALLCRLDAANAQASPEVQQACTPDAMRLCGEFVPDVAKITACMKAKHSQISETCRTAMRGGAKPGGHERHRRRARVHCGTHSRHCD